MIYLDYKTERIYSSGEIYFRDYERIKLIPVPLRRKSGCRMYSMDDLIRLAFIRHAKELGFILNEIKELLGLRVDTKSNCDEVRAQVEAKVVDIEQKIIH